MILDQFPHRSTTLSRFLRSVGPQLLAERWSERCVQWPSPSGWLRVTLVTFSYQNVAATSGPSAAVMQRAELCHSPLVEGKQKHRSAENNAGADDSGRCDATLNFLNTANFLLLLFFKRMLNFADGNCQAGNLGGLAQAS